MVKLVWRLPGNLNYHVVPNQVILVGTLTGVQGDIRCKVLAALSTVDNLSWNWSIIEGCNRKKCMLVIFFIKMKCILVRFLKHVKSVKLEQEPGDFGGNAHRDTR